MNKKTTAFTGLVLVLILSASVFAMPRWDVDFENDVVGETPVYSTYAEGLINVVPQDVREGGVSGAGYSGPKVTVVDGFTDSVTGETLGSKVVKFDSPAAASGEAYTLIFEGDDDQTTTGVIKVTWDVLTDSVDGGRLYNILMYYGQNLLYICLASEGDDDPAMPNYGDPDSGVVEIWSWSQVGGDYVIEYPTTFPKGEVLHMKAIVDLDADPNQLITVSMNEQEIGTWNVPSSPNPFLKPMFSRFFITSDLPENGGSVAAVDNVRILAVPTACGDEGSVYLQQDINKDCDVDFKDMKEIVANWLVCNDPGGCG